MLGQRLAKPESRGYQDPEYERYLDRNRDQIVIPPALHSPFAEEIARAARSLMMHLSGETDPILWEWGFVEASDKFAARELNHLSIVG